MGAVADFIGGGTVGRIGLVAPSAAGRAAAGNIAGGWGAAAADFDARLRAGVGSSGGLGGALSSAGLGGGTEALRDNEKAARGAAASNEELNDALRRRDALLDELGGAQRVYDKAVANADDLLRRKLITDEQHGQALALARRELQEADPLWQKTQRLISDSITPTEELAARQATLNEAWAKGAISAADYHRVLTGLDAERADLAERLYPTDQLDRFNRRGGGLEELIGGATGGALRGLGDAATDRSRLANAHGAAAENLRRQQEQGLIDHRAYVERMSRLDQDYA